MDINYLKSRQEEIEKRLLLERVDSIDDLDSAKELLRDIMLDLYDVHKQLDELGKFDEF